MALFSRTTKKGSRGIGGKGDVKFGKFISANNEKALLIELIDDEDGATYSMCLYGEEYDRLVQCINNEKFKSHIGE